MKKKTGKKPVKRKAATRPKRPVRAKSMAKRTVKKAPSKPASKTIRRTLLATALPLHVCSRCLHKSHSPGKCPSCRFELEEMCLECGNSKANCAFTPCASPKQAKKKTR